AVGPAVEPLADAGRERIVDGRVAERALDADRLQSGGAGEEAGDADDGVQLQQRQRRRRIVQVDGSRLDAGRDVGGHRICVDLQADGQRRLRADARTDAAVRAPGD